MLVRELMTTDPVTVRASTPIKDAVALLDRLSITMLPVVSGDAHVCGVLSEADVIRDRVLPDSRAHMIPPSAFDDDLVLQSVGEVMNHRVMSVRHDTDVAEATDLMTSTSVKSLPVVDDHGRLIGMLSRRDIVHALSRTDDTIEQEIGELLRRLGVDWLVDVRDGRVSIAGPIDQRERSLAGSAASTVRGVVRVHVD
jgi:CBS-domain-containing membrane protein